MRTDEELMTGLGKDPTALEELYRRHVGKVIAFAARRCFDPESVADLVAATWVAFLESAGRYDPRRGTPLAYLLGITARQHGRTTRRFVRERAALQRLQGRRLLDPEDHARLEEQIDAARLAPLLSRAMADLPARQRDVLDLVIAGLSPDEAARALGITPANARMRLARARRAMRQADLEPALEMENLP